MGPTGIDINVVLKHHSFSDRLYRGFSIAANELAYPQTTMVSEGDRDDLRAAIDRAKMYQEGLISLEELIDPKYSMYHVTMPNAKLSAEIAISNLRRYGDLADILAKMINDLSTLEKIMIFGIDAKVTAINADRLIWEKKLII